MSSGGGKTRSWNDDRRLFLRDPIVRRDIARVLDRDVLGCGLTGRRGDRLDDSGRVKTFLDVGLRRKVAGCGPVVGSASSCSTGIVAATTDVEPVSKVWPGTRVAACEGWKSSAST